MILKQRWFIVCTIFVIFLLIVHQCDAAKRKDSSRKSSSDHDSKSRNGSKSGRTSSSSSSATQKRTESSAPRHDEKKTIGWNVQSVNNSSSSASKSRSSATQKKPIGWDVPSANNSPSSASKLSSSTTKKKPKTVGWNVPTANNSSSSASKVSSSATKKKPKTSTPRKEEKKINGNVQSENNSSSSKSKGSKVSSSTTKKGEKKPSNSNVKDFLLALLNNSKDDNRGRSTTRKKTPKSRKNSAKAPVQNTEQAPVQAQTPLPPMPVYAGIPPPLPPPINQITDRDCVITMKLLNCSEIRLCPQGWLPPSCLQRTISKEYFDSVILPPPPTAAPINQITDLDCVYAMKILNCSEIRLCPQEWLHPACLHRTISKEYFDSVIFPPPAPLPTMPVAGQSPQENLSGPIYYDQNKGVVQAHLAPSSGVPLGNSPDSTNALVTPSPPIVALNDKVTDLDCVYAMKILNCFEIRQCPQERLHPSCLQRTISKEYFDSVTFPPPPSLLPIPEAGQVPPGPIYSDQNKNGAQAQDVAIENTLAVQTSFSPTPDPLPSSHSANSTNSLVAPPPATPVTPQL